MTGAGGTRHYGATWLTPPPAPRLALAGVRPNPGAGELTVAFSLPGPQPVRLELFDLAGRRVHDQRLEGLGAGTHVVPFLAGARPRPGLYWLRLTQGGASAAAKVTLLR